jgi:hypothetical protein
VELTDTMLRPTTGFLCAYCGSAAIAVAVGERDGRLVVVLSCMHCDNQVEFVNDTRSN